MNKIVSTPQQWKKFWNCEISKYFKKNSEYKDRQEALAVVRDVCMHWHYTHAMICWAELLQEVGLKCTIFICNIWYSLQAIDNWVFKTPGLCALLLTEDEWKTLGLQLYLKDFSLSTFTAIHGGDPTDVSQQNPNHSICLTHLSQNGEAPWSCLDIMGALIQDTACCWTGPCCANLRKYSLPAKLHHSYILGTGKSFCHSLNPKYQLLSFL